MVWSSISFDNELKREMGRNILLSGGSTLFEGLSERLQAELLSLAPAGTDIRILFNTNKRNSVWNGAQIFSSLPTMEKFWINKRDYSEFGGSILSRK